MTIRPKDNEGNIKKITMHCEVSIIIWADRHGLCKQYEADWTTASHVLWSYNT